MGQATSRLEITDERAKQMLEELKVVADKIIGFMGLSDKLKTKLVADSCCDSELRIGNMGCSIMACGVKHKSILGDHEVEGFVGGHSVYCPGVRYYKDGSGEPPSEDYVENFESSYVETAAQKGIELALELLLSTALEVYAESQLYRDSETEEF